MEIIIADFPLPQICTDCVMYFREVLQKETGKALQSHFKNFPSHSKSILPCVYVVATHSGKQTHSEGQCRQWSAVYYTGGPKAESPLSQGPRPVFVKTLYTLSVRAQTHLPKFPETSLNKGKRNIQSKLTHDSYALSLGS